MKNIKIIGSLFLLFTALTFTSCENEPLDPELNLDDFGGGNNGGSSSTYYVRAKVNGTLTNWNTIQAQYIQALNSIVILAAAPNGASSMSLHLIKDDNTDFSDGVYPLTWTLVGCGHTVGAEIFSSDYSDFNTSPGNITILEYNTSNKTIKGTFSFVGKNDDMSVTNTYTEGEFFVNYTEQ
ncbi:hypothetical protein [Flavobacterium sp.]|uniref:hypothetical protein n=1 Tax=Flavobacterium sp. TaxID=239 RepID=UPI0035B494F8